MRKYVLLPFTHLGGRWQKYSGHSVCPWGQVSSQGCVVAATVFSPNFLKFWAPPHDLALFLNRRILELIGRGCIFE